MSNVAASVRPHFIGLPLRAWAYALRIWLAMTAALYAGFWLQLGTASSAAVTVGILALPTITVAISCERVLLGLGGLFARGTRR